MAMGETFKATVVCAGADGTAYVFDYGYADTDGNVHVDTGIAAGHFQTLVQAKILAVLADDVTITGYRFACVKSPTHLGEIGWITGVDQVGQMSAVNRLPNEVAICLKRSTGYASKRNRGRIFFGPVCQNLLDNANVNKPNTQHADLLALRDTLKAGLATQGAGLFPVILAADGTYSGNIINRADINPIFCHRKTRRPRVGA